MFLLLAALACTSANPPVDTDTGEEGETGETGDTAVELGTPPEVERVELTTDDGVVLVGDYYGQTAPTPAVLLLHMIPPNYDRGSWPNRFIELLRDSGFSVLALDRRGAGESGGDAVDAYTGELGVNDAFAAAAFFETQEATSISIIGASNGTTTTMDYAVEAEGAGWPAPRAIVWMSPGSYTESQHRLAELEMADVLELYPTSEASWAERAAGKAPQGEAWTLIEYDPGSHGTDLFMSDRTVDDDILAWLLALE
jgi:pimeloyl-ACP methyl ester carboxylesterase